MIESRRFEFQGEKSFHFNGVVRVSPIDLKFFEFLQRFGGGNPGRKFQIPRSEARDSTLDLIKEFRRLNMINFREEIPKRTYSPATAGNVVVEPLMEYDSRIAELINISPFPLTHILNFAMKANGLEYFDLYPNLSTRELKGMAIKFNPDTPKWWRNLLNYQQYIPIGRRIIVAALPIDVYSFIGISNNVLEVVENIGNNSDGMLKWVRFYYDDKGRLFIGLSIGPTKRERVNISEKLREIHHWREVAKFISDNEKIYDSRGIQVTQEITERSGLQKPEIILRAPYVTIDAKRGLFVSGGFISPNDFYPYITKSGDLIIHRGIGRNNITIPIGPKRIKKIQDGLFFQSVHDVLFPDKGISEFEMSLMGRFRLNRLEYDYFSPTKL